MNNELMFSSKTDQWSTPIDFFNKWDEMFGFTLDVCADSSNTKCSQFFSEEENGLLQHWDGNCCWMNPPYGREIGKWVKKAFDETRDPDTNTLVVALLPARTDTKYFHDYIWDEDAGNFGRPKEGVQVHFVKGRIKFGDASSGAPFPSMVVVFGYL
jgi:phage N-6-adenine-methyltransferase